MFIINSGVVLNREKREGVGLNVIRRVNVNESKLQRALLSEDSISIFVKKNKHVKN